ncbi:MAG: response regulator [Dehalococcoidales bacterium]|jgi:two-component system chemotaxis response regulator CheY|nr:response regulator [Dehalococcoidales bacterium]
MAKILIVDDSALVRMKCSKVLSSNGYSVIEAENGEEALAKYKEHKPDGVLMDIVMPIMHGITALHEIRKIDPVAKVAMLTAMGQKSMVASALQEGARDFVVKPFREGRVIDTVQRLLNNTKID